MDLAAATASVSQKFQYRADRIRIFDSWRVMDLDSPVCEGDCEDFALTVFWLISGRSIGRFLWNLLITHRYRMVYSRTRDGEAHFVGNFGDQWFDNWSRKPMDRDAFFQSTGHRKIIMYPGPIIAVYLLIGLVIR